MISGNDPELAEGWKGAGSPFIEMEGIDWFAAA